jgi:VCBS repeat-containing protein
VIVVNETPVVGPVNGSLSLANDGSFVYTPDENFNGMDSFVYELTDSDGEQTLGTVTIDVTPVNDAPVLTNEQITSANQGFVALSDDTMLANDVDVDGDDLTIVDIGTPQFGSLIDNGDGTYVYIPPPGFVGGDFFSYTVEDSDGARSTATVYVNVLGDFSEAVPETRTGDPATDSGPSVDDPVITPAAGDTENQADSAISEPVDTDLPTPPPDFNPDPVVAVAIDRPGLPFRSPGLTADALLADEIRDGLPKVKLQKFLYDGVLDGFEFQGFGLKTAGFDQDALWQALDDMKRQMSGLDDSSNGGFVISSIVGGSSLLLTTGLISWVLRGGALASALISTLPLWKGVDPLPLLAGRRKSKKKVELTDTQPLDHSQNSDLSKKVYDAEKMFSKSLTNTDSSGGAGQSS